jgi:glutamate-1-semialdehyde 2,1-aminomutase
MPARARDGVGKGSTTHDRAAASIVGGASTGSKRAEALYGGPTPAGPTHYREAAGCTVIADDGRSYIDCTMALGSVALGYADPGVTRRVTEAVRAGNVAAWSPILEVEVAERLCAVIPCAERVRFFKTGAEAVAAAVRIARTATGRSRVAACGYFGWLDWSSDSAGVPDGVRTDFERVPFDDVSALEDAVMRTGRNLAAVVIEPVIERLPSELWIRRARELCDRVGAVLIFDEVKTGFRLRSGGYQSIVGVLPDLCAVGKALANGFPLSAVVGRESVMEAARSTWISSTLASETSALAAAMAVLERHASEDVCASLGRIGGSMRGAVQAALDATGFTGATLDGIDPMWMIRFERDADQDRFLTQALGEGVIFKRGAYNFAALAHDDAALGRIGEAAHAAFHRLARGPA